jgi:hypothetical protein
MRFHIHFYRSYNLYLVLQCLTDFTITVFDLYGRRNYMIIHCDQLKSLSCLAFLAPGLE